LVQEHPSADGGDTALTALLPMRLMGALSLALCALMIALCVCLRSRAKRRRRRAQLEDVQSVFHTETWRKLE